MSCSRSIFHGTTLAGLAGIISEDAIYEGVHWQKPGEPHGPRFFESIKPAWLFGRDDLGENSPGGVIEVDFDKIKKRYKFERYRDATYEGDVFENEEEEIVILTKKLRLSPYLISVYLSPGVYEVLSSAEDTEREIQFSMNQHGGNKREWRQMYGRLWRHVRLRPKEFIRT